MADYIDKKLFLADLGLHGDETKYGNRDAEHQHRSYAYYMGYEIMGAVEDCLVEEELVPVVYGQWEQCPSVLGYLRCSACHDAYIDEEWQRYGKWGYCPNCGAKMDGGPDG